MAIKELRVGVLGAGNVGSAFTRLIESRKKELESLTGYSIVPSGVLTRSQGVFSEILESSDVIVELIGGIEPARDYVMQALTSGKDVITANKQLIAQYGDQLFRAAAKNSVQLRYEAAVAGVVPIIKVLQESFSGIEIKRIHGIVNGTTNFILSEMERGSSYQEALLEAQEKGYAEADPTSDVEGHDAAAKMSILARLAFGASVSLEQVACVGITDLKSDDLQYASEFSLSLKLLGIAERIDEGISVRVHPTFLYPGHPLAAIHGSFNALTIESEQIEEVTLSGPGAGGAPTAASVFSDLISICAHQVPRERPSQEMELIQDIKSAFYLHFEVADQAGVLAAIAKIMDQHGASIKSVIQKGEAENARLMMVTYPLPESELFAALNKISACDFMRSSPRAIRVISEP